MLPLLFVDLSAPWQTRVEASDAAPGGHGRAYTQWAEGHVLQACRLSVGKGVHTSLHLPLGVALDEAGRCALQQISIDPAMHVWKEIARPGGYRHIGLEEAAALLWSLTERLKRPTEVGRRSA